MSGMEVYMGKIKVIINTDIGDDADDTLAIAYALECEEIEVIGITTVYKNVEQRAKMVYSVLKEYGRTDIPIYLGSKYPILNRPDVEEAPKLIGTLESSDFSDYQEDAVEFIIRSIKEAPDTVILEMGPQTNLALAYLKAPKLMKHAKVVAMGGYFQGVYPEWNIVCDPEAAKIVTDLSKNLTMIGLDMTIQTQLEEKHRTWIENGNNPHRDYLNKVMMAWYELTGFSVILHDVLLVEYLIHPELFTLEEGTIEVSVSEGNSRGITYAKLDAFNPSYREINGHKYVTKIDAEKFINRFLKRMF